MSAFGSNRAGVFVTPAPGSRGSNRTVKPTEKTLAKKAPKKPVVKKGKK